MTDASATEHPLTLYDDIQAQLARDAGADIGLGDLLARLGGRGFGFVYVVFGMLAAVLPAGLCSLMSVPILLFAGQQFLRQARPVLPARLDTRRVSTDALSAGLARRETWFRHMERIARPRWPWLAGIGAYRLAALFCGMLALVILVPGPFTNVPPGMAIALFGFAMAERDGLLMLAAFAIGILAFAIGLSAVAATVWLLANWLGSGNLLP